MEAAFHKAASISKTIQIRRASHVGHSWRGKGSLISDVRGAYDKFPDFYRMGI